MSATSKADSSSSSKEAASATKCTTADKKYPPMSVPWVQLLILEQADVSAHRALTAFPEVAALAEKYNTWEQARRRAWQAADYAYFVQQEDKRGPGGYDDFAQDSKRKMAVLFPGGRYRG